MANGHGGARPGSGRKPKALQYQEEVAAIERRILGMLPRLVDKLYEMALDGDIRANRYLIERITGRIPLLEAAPSVDQAMPYGERDFAVQNLEHNIALSEEELRLEQRVEDMFVYVGDDDGDQMSDDPVPIPTDDANDPDTPCDVTSAGPSKLDTPLLARNERIGRGAGGEGMALAVGVPDSIPFIASDGPNDPDRTWYSRDLDDRIAVNAGIYPHGRVE